MKNNMHLFTFFLLVFNLNCLIGQVNISHDSLWGSYGNFDECIFSCENDTCILKEKLIIQDNELGSCPYDYLDHKYYDKWYLFDCLEFNLDSLERFKQQIIHLELNDGINAQSRDRQIIIPNLLFFDVQDNEIPYQFVFNCKQLRHLGMNIDGATRKDMKSFFLFQHLETVITYSDRKMILPKKKHLRCIKLKYLRANIDLSSRRNIKKLGKLKELKEIFVGFYGENYGGLQELDFIEKIHIINMKEEQKKYFKECCPNVVIPDYKLN